MPVATGAGSSVAPNGAPQGTRVDRPLHPGTGGATRSAPKSDAESAARGESTPTTPRGTALYRRACSSGRPLARHGRRGGGRRGAVCGVGAEYGRQTSSVSTSTPRPPVLVDLPSQSLARVVHPARWTSDAATMTDRGDADAPSLSAHDRVKVSNSKRPLFHYVRLAEKFPSSARHHHRLRRRRRGGHRRHRRRDPQVAQPRDGDARAHGNRHARRRTRRTSASARRPSSWNSGEANDSTIRAEAAANAAANADDVEKSSWDEQTARNTTRKRRGRRRARSTS